jgi:hypothetical protein
MGHPAPALLVDLPQWAGSRGVDSVLWAALGPKFEDDNGRVPTVEQTVLYYDTGSVSLSNTTGTNKIRIIGKKVIKVPYKLRRIVLLTTTFTTVFFQLPGQAQAPIRSPRITTGDIDNIRYVDGIFNRTVQQAINSLPSGEGTVIVPCGTYVGPTTFYSGLHIEASCPFKQAAFVSLGFGSTSGAARLTYSAPLTITNVNDLSIDGVVLDFGGSGGLVLEGGVSQYFRMSVINCASSSPCVTLSAPSGINYALNTFQELYTSGGSESLRLVGTSSGGSETGDVTDNFFGNLQLVNPNNGSGTGTFVDVACCADSNIIDYAGFWAFGPGAPVAINGIIWNSSNPNGEAFVYNDSFRHVDWTTSVTAGASYQLNYSHNNQLIHAVDPGLPDNGQPTVNAACKALYNCNLIDFNLNNSSRFNGYSERAFKFARFGSISVAGGAGNMNTVTYTWNTPFYDNEYTPVCTGQGAIGAAILSISSWTASQIKVTITNTGSGAASYNGVNCHAKYDTIPQW